MGELRFLSKIEQVAAHLRAELAGGRWEEAMPGRLELAAELGINAKTVEEALRLLEKEGVLVGQAAAIHLQFDSKSSFLIAPSSIFRRVCQ